ncbi:hypothetical protein OKW45_005005 [Paraburkholderia sp. WSM4175]|uniref:hypothetical protein n=1 Tax=Paraburkholderia sp. WSM4175 TaxID=2991072 RepID=UPI003D1D1DAE
MARQRAEAQNQRGAQQRGKPTAGICARARAGVAAGSAASGVSGGEMGGAENRRLLPAARRRSLGLTPRGAWLHGNP